MYPLVSFSNNTITKCPHRKHLGVVIDYKLDFNIHIEHERKKCNKIIGLIRRLSICLSVCLCHSQDKLYLPFTNLWLDLILIVVMFCMRNQTTEILKTNLNRFSNNWSYTRSLLLKRGTRSNEKQREVTRSNQK